MKTIETIAGSDTNNFVSENHNDLNVLVTFVESVFNQIKDSKTEITFGFSEMVANANPEIIRETFKRINP